MQENETVSIERSVKQVSKLVRDPSLKDRLPLRRYMDLAKFIDLLRSRSIYLRRADRFPDRFEGALIPIIRASINDAYKRGISKYDADAFYEKCRQSIYVSCWSIGEDDNMALWQLYGGVNSSVAVTTTVGRLTKDCLTWNQDVFMHAVQYIEHSKSPDMIIGRYTDPLRFKHNAYKFENEMRVLLPRIRPMSSKNPHGLRIPLADLEQMIKCIVVAPEAEAWFFELIKDIVRRYGLSVPVRRSKLTYIPK